MQDNFSMQRLQMCEVSVWCFEVVVIYGDCVALSGGGEARKGGRRRRVQREVLL